MGSLADAELRIEEIAARYLDLLKAGAAPDPEALAAAYPDIADRLKGRLGEVAKSFRGVREKNAPYAGALGSTIDLGTPDPLERVGPYKILEALGQGGMGAVYLAEQTEPVRRRVALKLIKLGMDTREVIARFESERQALALMDHPNIAHVFDAGTTEAGRPYFVMEHVQGISITDYCDKHRLATTDRLKLFQQVCEGVQHAHQKGIIHRDLKPSNILVTVPGGKPLAKIIDFGVAKSTQQHLTERTVFTQQGRLIGTPEYMSPEQAEMTPLDVDTRSDIYSLGVVLYRLLVGTLPFDAMTRQGESYDEIRRRIREEDPPRPSTRLDSLGEDARPVAKCRGTDPGSLRRLLRGELDWITMKALEKDRTRRYATASELTADIGRHLRNEPVLAGPPSATYRWGKFLRRNRAAVLATLAVMLVLVAWFTSTRRMYLRAERAQLAEVRQRKATVAALGQTRAEQHAIQRMASRSEREEKKGQAEALYRAMVMAKREVWGEDHPSTWAALIQLAYVLEWRGDPQRLAEAERTWRLVFESRRRFLGPQDQDTLWTAERLLNVLELQEKHEEAEPFHRERFQAAQRQDGEEAPQALVRMRALAKCLRRQGKLAEAEGLLRSGLDAYRKAKREKGPDTLEWMTELAVVLNLQGRGVECDRIVREVVEKCGEITGDQNLDSERLILDAAHFFENQGMTAAAEAVCRRSLDVARREIGEEAPLTVSLLLDLGYFLYISDRCTEAEPVLREFLDGGRRTLGEEDLKIARASDYLGDILFDRGRVDEAERLWRKSFEISRGGGRETRGLLIDLARVARARGRLGEAERLYLEALEAGEDAADGLDLRTLRSMIGLAGVRQDQERDVDAQVILWRVMGHCADVLEGAHPNVLPFQLTSIADSLRHHAMVEEAESLLRQTSEVRRKVLGKNHDSSLSTVFSLAALLKDQQRFTEAEGLLVGAYEGLVERGRARDWHRGEALRDLASLYAAWGKAQKAEECRELLESSEMTRSKE